MTRQNEDAQAEFLRTHPEAAKPSNPKDAFGSAKVPVGLAPDTALQEMALAFLEGATKYGRYNWRVVGVRASIYNDAMERHRMKWWNGQNRDPVTRVRELASVMACCAILIDSEICGVLNDDRPPMAPMGELLDINMQVVAHLKDLFKDHHPDQFTIADTPGMNEPEPEGFPTGYELHPDLGAPEVPGTLKELQEMAAAAPPATALLLPCGCAKRCKGHAVSTDAAKVDATPIVREHRGCCTVGVCTNERGLYMLTCAAHAPTEGAAVSSPGNYAAERAAGPKDPQGRPYATTTADAEFPQPPPVHRPVEAAREFDPAD